MNKTKITAEPGKQELFIERELDAPRVLVFKAHTDPKLYAKWVGPKRLENRLEKSGGENGAWVLVSTDKDGSEYRFHGVYHEVTYPLRLIGTFEYDGNPEKGHVSLETARFEELPNDRTKITAQSVFQSVADRDAMVEAGMQEGVEEGYEKLDKLLEEMKKEDEIK